VGLGVTGGLVAESVIGGVTSVAGGGKFQNGAVTAAFGYLFNACGHRGCWTTNEERALVDKGDFLGYYTKACEGGDQYACFAYGVASSENPGPGVTLRRALFDHGYSPDQISSLVKTTIPTDLARDYAPYLPQSEDQARFPLATDIAQFHWNEFAKYVLPSSTFGGTPFGRNGPLVLKGLWCGDTCR